MAPKPIEKRWVDEYLIDLDPTAAAIRSGVSSQIAQAFGDRMLKNKEVSRAIALAMDERKKQTQVDAGWVLKSLAGIWDSDLVDIMNDDGTYKPLSEWPLIWRKMVSGIDVAEMSTKVTENDSGSETTVRQGRILKAKFMDKLKVLELIGRHIDVKAFEDKAAALAIPSGGISINVNFVPAGRTIDQQPESLASEHIYESPVHPEGAEADAERQSARHYE